MFFWVVSAEELAVPRPASVSSDGATFRGYPASKTCLGDQTYILATSSISLFKF